MADWPCHLSSSAGFNLWYCRPGVIVNQAWAPRLDGAYAEDLIATIDAVIRLHEPSIMQSGGLAIIDDWRSMDKGIDGSALRALGGVWQETEGGAAIKSVHASIPMGFLARAGISALNIVARLASGIEFTMVEVDDFPMVWSSLQVADPRDGESLPALGQTAALAA